MILEQKTQNPIKQQSGALAQELLIVV